MRVWLGRFRTLAAVLATVYLIWQMPVLYRALINTESSQAQQAAPQLNVLRVWVCEDWTGTSLTWLSRQASAFEKQHKGTRVIIRRVQKGDWLAEGAVLPDVLLFSAGMVTNPETLFTPQSGNFAIKEALSLTGDRDGVRLAVPICYGGIVRLVNEQEPSDIELVMQTDKDYQSFIAGNAGSLIATVREARRLAALVEAGKGFAYSAQAYGTQTDKLLMAGQLAGDSTRSDMAKAFIEYLLSGEAQNTLTEQGLLPASERADPPDEEKQPLLYAIWQTSPYAVNAFD